MIDKTFKVAATVSTVTYKVFEDNEGALELAQFSKMRSRTKYANQTCHYFRSHVADKDIKTQSINTKVQIGDMFTKPLAKD